VRKIKIANKLVGEDEPTFIIAEAGSNHDGKFEQAKKLIDIAADAGVDAVKFQTFLADKIIAKTGLKTEYMEKVGMKGTVYDIFKKIELPREWLPELARYADREGLIFLSSTFDKEGVDLLDEIGVPAFKIASGELTNLPLLKYTAEKGKPLIISTGASALDEIKEAITVIRSAGNEDVILLHCVSSYPAAIEDVNIKSMITMRQTFQLLTGYSDHTLGIVAPLVAVAMGAVMIEKHFTLNRSLPGPDHSYALEPQELEAMVETIRTVEKLLGSPIKQPAEAELENRRLGGRSIFAKRDIPAGTSITEEMLTLLRPAIGLQPKYLEAIIGRKARTNIKQYEPITWDKI
jgi:N-acetylneuraminate synthase